MKPLIGSLGLLTLVLLGCGHNEATVSTVLQSESSGAKTLVVQCADFNNGVIPVAFSGYGQGSTPHLTWQEVPKGTKAMVLIVEDPDAPGFSPYVHWLVINMPPSAKSAPDQGTVLANSDGKKAYFPPTPPDDKPHHYHFELFALDAMVPASATDRDAVEKAMRGTILGQGELVAVFQKT